MRLRWLPISFSPVARILSVESYMSVVSLILVDRCFSPVARILSVERGKTASNWKLVPCFSPVARILSVESYIIVTQLCWVSWMFQSRCQDSVSWKLASSASMRRVRMFQSRCQDSVSWKIAPTTRLYLCIMVSVPLPGFCQLKGLSCINPPKISYMFQSRCQDSVSWKLFPRTSLNERVICFSPVARILSVESLYSLGVEGRIIVFQSRCQDSVSWKFYIWHNYASDIGVSVPLPGFCQLKGSQWKNQSHLMCFSPVARILSVESSHLPRVEHITKLFQSRCQDSVSWKPTKVYKKKTTNINVSVPLPGFCQLKAVSTALSNAASGVSVPLPGFCQLKDRFLQK